MKQHRIFVYGTLKQGCYNHNRVLQSPDKSFMTAATFVRIEEVTGYKLYTGYYPRMVKSDKDTDVVKGEVYLLDDNFKQALDALERGYGYVEVKPGTFSYVGDIPRISDEVPLNAEGIYEWTPEYELKMNDNHPSVKAAQDKQKTTITNAA